MGTVSTWESLRDELWVNQVTEGRSCYKFNLNLMKFIPGAIAKYLTFNHAAIP